MSLYIAHTQNIINRSSDYIFYFSNRNLFCLINKQPHLLFEDLNGDIDDIDNIFNYCESHHIDSYEIVIDGYQSEEELNLLFENASNYLLLKDVSIGLLTLDEDFIDDHMRMIKYYGITYSTPPINLFMCSYKPNLEPTAKQKRVPRSHDEQLRFCVVATPKPHESTKKKTASNIVLDESFNTRLMRLLRESGKDNVDIYKDGGISKQVFSNAISNSDTVPSKNTVICLAIGMELGYIDAMSLLEAAGYTLSKSIKFDVIVAKYFRKRNYDLFELNSELNENECPLLGWQPREDK